MSGHEDHGCPQLPSHNSLLNQQRRWDACRLGAQNLRVGRLSRAVMCGPEEWPSCGTWSSAWASAQVGAASLQTEFGLQARLPTLSLRFVKSAQTTLTTPSDCSVLRCDFSGKGLSYYFPVPHKKCVGSEFVRIVCCFCGPENVSVVPDNGSYLHGKGRAWLSELRNEGLKKGLNRFWTLQARPAQTTLRPTSNRTLHPRHRSQQMISDGCPEHH
jgi:hypothetical protein